MTWNTTLLFGVCRRARVLLDRSIGFFRYRLFRSPKLADIVGPTNCWKAPKNNMQDRVTNTHPKWLPAENDSFPNLGVKYGVLNYEAALPALSHRGEDTKGCYSCCCSDYLHVQLPDNPAVFNTPRSTVGLLV